MTARGPRGTNPRPFQARMVILTDAETARLNHFVIRVGHLGRATERLGISAHTFDAARGFGRMQSTTRERVLEALAREEAVSP